MGRCYGGRACIGPFQLACLPNHVYVCSKVSVESEGTTCSSWPSKTLRSASGPATAGVQGCGEGKARRRGTRSSQRGAVGCNRAVSTPITLYTPISSRWTAAREAAVTWRCGSKQVTCARSQGNLLHGHISSCRAQQLETRCLMAAGPAGVVTHPSQRTHVSRRLVPQQLRTRQHPPAARTGVVAPSRPSLLCKLVLVSMSLTAIGDAQTPRDASPLVAFHHQQRLS